MGDNKIGSSDGIGTPRVTRAHRVEPRDQSPEQHRSPPRAKKAKAAPLPQDEFLLGQGDPDAKGDAGTYRLEDLIGPKGNGGAAR